MKYGFRRGAPLAALCTASFMSSAAWADVVLLKNGDRISGTIVSAAGGKVVITPDFDKTSNITVKQTDIATFSSPTPMLIKLAGGAVINQPVETGATGQIKTSAVGAQPPQAIPLDKIDKINPNYAWTGSVSANGLYSHALQDTAQIGLNGDIGRTTDNDKITASAGFLYAEQKTQGVSSTTANTWFTAAQYDYYLAKPWYVYANTRFEADRINYLAFRATPGVGVGYQWFDAPDLSFSTEGGITYVYQDYTVGGTNSNASVRVAYHLTKSWSNNRVSLFNDGEFLESVEGGGNYLANADLGVRVGLTKTMFSKAEADLNYTNQPAPGAQQTVTKYTIGVGWTF